jgi:hypothetical protein
MNNEPSNPEIDGDLRPEYNLAELLQGAEEGNMAININNSSNNDEKKLQEMQKSRFRWFGTEN